MKSLHKTLLNSLAILSMTAFFGCGGNSDPIAPQAGDQMGMAGQNGGLEAAQTDGRSAQITWSTLDELLTEPNHDPAYAADAHHGDIWFGSVQYGPDMNDFFRMTFDETADPESAAIYARLEWTGAAHLNLYLRGPDLAVLQVLEYDGTTDHEFLVTGLEPATYYVQVASFDGYADYTLKLASAHEYLEPANDFASTTSWEYGSGDPSWIYNAGTGVVKSVISQYNPTLGSDDFIKFDVAQNRIVEAEFDIVMTEGAYFYARIYRIDGGLASPITPMYTGVTPLTIETDALDAGEYAIRVHIYGGIGIYDLDINQRFNFDRLDWLKDRLLIPIFEPPGPGPVIRIPRDPFINNPDKIGNDNQPDFDQPMTVLQGPGIDEMALNMQQIGY